MRLMEETDQVFAIPVAEVMTKEPKTIFPTRYVTAVNQMENHGIARPWSWMRAGQESSISTTACARGWSEVKGRIGILGLAMVALLACDGNEPTRTGTAQLPAGKPGMGPPTRSWRTAST